MSRNNQTYPIRKAIINLIIGELTLIFLMIVGYYFLTNLNSQSTDRLVFRYPYMLLLHFLGLFIQIGYLLSLKNTNKITSLVKYDDYCFVFQAISFKKSLIKYFLLRMSLFFIVFALAQPFYGVQKVKSKVNSMELVVVLDISNSMNTKDIDRNTTRLEVSKRAVNQLVSTFTGEKIGLVIFAGSSYVQLPLTNDYSATKMFIDEINTSMISNQGTNIANALETSMGMFSKDKNAKNILLVTDGENHEANPSAIYQALKEKEIDLSVVGIGTVKGGLIPNNPKRPELGYKIDPTGKPILSKLNKSFIQSIANQGSGVAMTCNVPYPNFKQLIDMVKQKSSANKSEVEFKIEKSKYQYPLLMAFICWSVFLLYNSQAIHLLNKFKK